MCVELVLKSARSTSLVVSGGTSYLTYPQLKHSGLKSSDARVSSYS